MDDPPENAVSFFHYSTWTCARARASTAHTRPEILFACTCASITSPNSNSTPPRVTSAETSCRVFGIKSNVNTSSFGSGDAEPGGGSIEYVNRSSFSDSMYVDSRESKERCIDKEDTNLSMCDTDQWWHRQRLVGKPIPVVESSDPWILFLPHHFSHKLELCKSLLFDASQSLQLRHLVLYPFFRLAYPTIQSL